MVSGKGSSRKSSKAVVAEPFAAAQPVTASEAEEASEVNQTTPSKGKARGRPSGQSKGKAKRQKVDNIEEDAEGITWLVQEGGGRCHYCAVKDVVCRTQITGSLKPGGRSIGSLLCTLCRAYRRTAHRCDVDLTPAQAITNVEKELNRRQRFDRRPITKRRLAYSGSPYVEKSESHASVNPYGGSMKSDVNYTATVQRVIGNLEDIVACIEEGTTPAMILPFLRRSIGHLESLPQSN